MKKVIRKRKKAFTLGELLIVVIVIGVLAAVAIPKFNNIIESRKTTEAESLLTAVRTEQERRCTFEKPYAGTFEKVGDIIAYNATNSSTAATESGNYTYQLKEQGIEAKSKSKDYSLNMLSYKDGRLCCSGAYCSSLNKSYPSCNGLNVEYETTCAAPACELDPTSCACNPNQCKCGPYAAANPCECNRQCNPGQSKSKPCASGCGTQTQSCTAQCQWSGSWSGSCSSPSAPSSCSCSTVGKTGTARPVSNCSGGYCDYSGCTSTPKPCPSCSGSSSDSRSCGTCGTQYRYRSCDCGTWGSWGSWGSCQGDYNCWTPDPWTPSPTVRPTAQPTAKPTAKPTTKPPTATPKPTTKAPTAKPTTKVPTTRPPTATPKPTTKPPTPKPECTNGETETGSACGNCGKQKRTCSNNKWSAWSCSNEGVCKPGTSTSCSDGMVKSCNASCQWNKCACPSGQSKGSNGKCCPPATINIDDRYGGCCQEIPCTPSGGMQCPKRCLLDDPMIR